MKKFLIEKRWQVMRICTTQFIFLLIFSGLTMAHPNFGQMLDQKITIELKQAVFTEALQEIESRAKIKFVYSIEQMKDETPVSISAENIALGKLLQDLFFPRNITFRIHEREASITLKKENQNQYRKSGTNSNKISVFQVAGTVTEAETQAPMPGVNVVIKGSTQGTSTDSQGKYTLAAAESDILVFTFIGYKPEERPVNSQSVIDVALQVDIQRLSEVTINAGYYVTKKETQTGNIGRVDAKEIEKQSVSNPIATLQARVPGLEIIQTTGVPGGNFRVRIRGQNSIANGNDPLYIIDGVPYFSSTLSFKENSREIYADGLGANPLNSINPQDIESIEVLKDADATAIYGSRGSNGVILITTKKGAAGKTNVEVTYKEGAGSVSSKMNLLKTDPYLEMRNEAYQNDGLTPTEADAPDLLVWDQNRNTDWQKELIGGSARFRDARISISGGDILTQFSIGGGYHRETTVFPGENNDQRISVHSNVNNVSPNGKLKTSLAFNYSASASTLPQKDLTSIALTLAPNAPAMLDDEGNLNWAPDSWHGTSLSTNPLSYTKSLFESHTFMMLGNSTIQYQIQPDLFVKTDLGFSRTGMQAVTTVPLSALDPAIVPYAKNTSSFSDNVLKNWIVEPQLNWKKKFGISALDILAGTSFLEQVNEGKAQSGVGFSSEALMRNINAADAIVRSSSVYSQYRYHAVFGRINYTLNDRYIINLTGRRDGSSRFGPGKQFSNFGAIGAAWIFSKTALIENSLSVISFGKLRASYGTTGNDQIGDYQYLDTYAPTGSGSYMGSTGLRPQRLFNPDFAWENVKKLEVGLELGFYEDRINLTLSSYRNRSSSQLIGTPLPPTTGFLTIQNNFPATVQNSGLEIELSTENIRRAGFTWITSANFTLPKNKLISFPGLATSPYANYYVVGEPLNVYKLFHYTGINAETGSYEFSDINGDDQYTFVDRTSVKSRAREFYGGLNNSVSYKGFQLDFLIEFVKQSGFNYLSQYNSTPGRLYSNQPDDVINRWRQPGDNAETQKYSTLSSYQVAYSNLQVSDHAFSDASFVRLKTLSFSWAFPRKLLSKMKIDALGFFIQGQNLLISTSYKGLNPENQSMVLPPLRVLTCGINAKL